MKPRQYAVYAATIWKRLWLVVLAVGIVGGATYVVERAMPPVYQAEFTMRVKHVIQDTGSELMDPWARQELGHVYTELVERESVMLAVKEALGLEVPWQTLAEHVDVRLQEEPLSIEIYVSDPDPSMAQVLANEIGRQLLLQSLVMPSKESQHRTFIQAQLGGLQDRIEPAETEIQELEEDFETADSPQQQQDLRGRIAGLQKQVEGWRTEYDRLTALLNGDEMSYLSVIEPAAMPTSAVGPDVTRNVIRNVLLVAVVGLAVVASSAFRSRSAALRRRDSETVGILDQLLEESLTALLLFTVAVVWTWTAYVFLFVDRYFNQAAAMLFLTLTTCWVSYRLSKRDMGLATGVYLFGLVALVVAVILIFQAPITLYLFVPVILIAAVLTNPRGMLGMMVLSLFLIWLVSRIGLSTMLTDIVWPAIFIVLTALTSWLSSRRLFETLYWALSVGDESRRHAEEARMHRAELQNVLKSLDQAYVRLERANEALIFAQESAEKAYQFKSEFVASVSHELRTPLNLITGFAEMIATAPESYKGVPLPKEYRGDVMAIYNSARHLSALIDDVLDLSRIEAGRMPLVMVDTDLCEVVREAADMVRGLAEARGLYLDVDVPEDLPMLPLDRTRIRQVLLNLLTNATRFTDEGGIRVWVRVVEDEVEVTVRDSGRGISPDRIARAFEAFSQLEDGQARQGSGLGLAVSKRFVEMHGGGMWVESEVGHGTLVGFALPMPGEEPHVQLSSLRTTPAPGHIGRPSVLVLHDDLQVLTLLNRYAQGYHFQLAENVDKAREMIREISPAVVVVDMVWANRPAVLTEALDLPPSVPLVTCPLPSMRRIGPLLGAMDYLPKPVTREDLEGALARLPNPPHTVLVVDDNPDVVRLLARMLGASDPSLRVLEAFDGEEGLGIMRAERPDLVLLDLVMPKMNGYAFLEAVRADRTLAETQVVVVSVRSIEQESAPIQGEIRLTCQEGLSLTEILQVLRATLAAVTQPAVMALSSDVALPVV